MKNKTFRISDEATSNEYTAANVASAVAQFIRKYDTAEMGSGETFQARLYAGDDLRELVAVVTVTADGKAGVATHTISPR